MTRREFALGTAAVALPVPPEDRFVGITVMPEYVQVEGIQGVLDNVTKRARATAVAISPYVMEPAGEKTGSREPPIDAGAGKVRLLDRPLWGKRELFVRTAPSFVPDVRLYRGLRYQPAPPAALTQTQGPILRRFIAEAHNRGLKVYFQIQAAIPPGYRVQFGGPAIADRPRLPDGEMPPRHLANNGSLASRHIRAYTEALIRDLVRAYPDIDGLRVDWPEYPPYLLDDVFLDFGQPAKAAAQRLGFPFNRMQRDAARLYALLHGKLTDDHLRAWSEPDGPRYPLLAALVDHPGLAVWLRFKATLVEELLAGFREALTTAGGKDKQLIPNAFPPPFTVASGMDYQRAAQHSDGISVKLYTMHWPMILRFYADALLRANPHLSEPLVVKILLRWFDITDGEPSLRLADWVYPEPDVPHPAGTEAQARKIRQARHQAGPCPVYALPHGYGPVDDFRHRLIAVYEPARRRVWVNRYGYLSDRKLEIIGEVTR